uniref:Uncharacterized protein n=1 Tax=Anguilla anguilla TaxID=7936 RepID=A0A0E9R0D2_ANGAN
MCTLTTCDLFDYKPKMLYRAKSRKNMLLSQTLWSSHKYRLVHVK